jgi:D-alanyl-D-alanine carboxypeptidase (penicillin-binding protein 5/6)
MNNKVKELNLKNTNFMNTTGLPDKGHYSSAFDIITMSSYLINNYPEILEYTKIYEDYLRKDSDKPFWLVNTNKLVKSHPDIDGLKSGWTEEALYCLSSTMMRDNQRFISVVMGCESVEKRNEDTISLLEYGLSNYESVKIYDKNKIVYSHYDIRYNPTTIDVILNKDIYILKKKNEELKEVNYNIVLKKDYLKNLNNAGTLELIYDNKIYSKHNLVIEEKINKNSILEIFKNLVKEYI